MPIPLKVRFAQAVAKEFKVGIWRDASLRYFLEQFRPSSRKKLDRHLTPQYFACQELIRDLPDATTEWDSKELGAELSGLVVRSEEQAEELSILSFHGIQASSTQDKKSFRDLALWLEPDRPRGHNSDVCFRNDFDFSNNKLIFEVRNGGSPVAAQRQNWNGRLDMINGQGSHHLAGVLRQCLDEGRDAVFSCRVRTVRVDAATADRMLRRWHLLMASDQTVRELRSSLDGGLFHGKQNLWYPGQEDSQWAQFNASAFLKRERTDLSIWAIPRSWKWGDEVRRSLLADEMGRVFDLSDYLSQLVDAQRQDPQDEPPPKGEQSSTGYRHPRGKDFPLA